MELTEEQRKRIEENRQKAILLRQEKSKFRAHTSQKYIIHIICVQKYYVNDLYCCYFEDLLYHKKLIKIISSQ
jgi:hypothetical protein